MLADLRQVEKELERELSRLRKEVWSRGSIETRVTIFEGALLLKYINPELTPIEKSLLTVIANNGLEHKVVELLYEKSVKVLFDIIHQHVPDIKVLSWKYVNDIEKNTTYAIVVFNKNLEKSLKQNLCQLEDHSK